MSDMDTPHIHAALELAELLQPTHAPGLDALRRSGVPLNADDGGDGGDGGDGDETGDEPTGDTTDHEAEAKKWKAMARKHEKAHKADAQRLKELEDANKSETQRAADKAAEAETRATTAEGQALRLDVAMDQAPDGMSVAQVRKLAKRLAGSTREELEEDAKELFADFAPSGDDDKPGKSGRRPKERLRSGAAPSDTDEDDEDDPAKLAAQVPRTYS